MSDKGGDPQEPDADDEPKLKIKIKGPASVVKKMLRGGS